MLDIFVSLAVIDAYCQHYQMIVLFGGICGVHVQYLS